MGNPNIAHNTTLNLFWFSIFFSVQFCEDVLVCILEVNIYFCPISALCVWTLMESGAPKERHVTPKGFHVNFS